MDGIKALQKAIMYGRGLGYLFGGPGLAKTDLLKITCAEWARAGRGIFHFTTAADMLEDLRAAYDDDEPQRALAHKEQKYLGYPLLAIDEVGAERSTNFATEKFFSLINSRHEKGTERGGQFLTIMAANISPKELDYRITDRLTDQRNFIVKLIGESYRPQLKPDRNIQSLYHPLTGEKLE